MATARDTVTPNQKGLSWGLGTFLKFILGGAWGPGLVGELSEFFGGGKVGLTHALYISACAGFLTFLCWWMAASRHPADVQRAKEASREFEGEPE